MDSRGLWLDERAVVNGVVVTASTANIRVPCLFDWTKVVDQIVKHRWRKEPNVRQSLLWLTSQDGKDKDASWLEHKAEIRHDLQNISRGVGGRELMQQTIAVDTIKRCVPKWEGPCICDDPWDMELMIVGLVLGNTKSCLCQIGPNDLWEMLGQGTRIATGATPNIKNQAFAMSLEDRCCALCRMRWRCRADALILEIELLPACHILIGTSRGRLIEYSTA